MFEWWPIEVWDPDIEEFEQKPLMKEVTRSISGDWATENKWARWPALPWTVVAGGAAILGYALSGMRLAIFVLFAFLYIAVFGQWQPSMQTLSFVLVAAPISVMLGLVFGVWAFKSKTVEKVINPFLNIAQIMPHFAYLIPVMVFFGIGDHAGAIATIIFATPPMVRLTILGLNKVPPEVTEAGLMSGCSRFQLLRKVQIPSARRDILIGVNQVIMQCLAMVVIASLIGAKGLGNDLLIALNRLRIGLALEIGIWAWANKQTDYFADQSFKERHKHLLMFLVVFAIGVVLAVIGRFVFKEGFNYLYLIPHNKGITTEPFWQAGVDWLWDTFFYSLKGFKNAGCCHIYVSHGCRVYCWWYTFSFNRWWVLTVHCANRMVG